MDHTRLENIVDKNVDFCVNYQAAMSIASGFYFLNNSYSEGLLVLAIGSSKSVCSAAIIGYDMSGYVYC